MYGGTALTITSAAGTTFTIGDAGSFTVTATGYPDAYFSLSGAPAWLSINPTTGVLSGTPTDPGTGGYSVSFNVTATNPLGSATQAFTLTVVSAVTGHVWDDLNGNGIQDAGEPGIAGAVAELFDGSGNSLGTRITDANGAYSFDVASPGSGYHVVIRPPVGFTFTAESQGSDPTKDSDVNATGNSAAFNVSSGVGIVLDAGLVGAAPNFGWAAEASGIGAAVEAHAPAIDAAGNVYVTGEFLQGTVDFDPGPGTVTLTSTGVEDAFVAKYTSVGALVWVRQISGNGVDVPVAIAVDSTDNVYITGQFSGTTDFDPNPSPTSTYILTSRGSYDPCGQARRRRQFRLGTAIRRHTSTTVAKAIQVDAAGDVYTTGMFSGTNDTAYFDPASTMAYSLTNTGSGTAFITKLDSSGNPIWVSDLTGSGYAAG